MRPILVHNIASKRPSQLFCNNNHSSRRLDLLLHFHFQPPGSILFAFLFEMLWFGKFEIQCGLKLTSSTPDQWTPFLSLLFFLHHLVFWKLFIFVKRCAQTPVFQWQLAFSQIGAKNGKNWQYRVTGKLCIKTFQNLKRSDIFWLCILERFSLSLLLYKGTNSSLKKRMLVKWMSFYKKRVK